MYDIGIIGAGTAGMTAAIYGLRAGKSVLLIEGATFGGQITSSPRVENYPGIASMSGNEFAAALVDQALLFGAETEFAEVTGLRREEPYWVIVTEDGEITCKSVILATGVTQRNLGLEKEEQLTGAGISYCAVCDGAFFKGQKVAVAGGGSTALQDAMFLSEYCEKVFLIHRRDAFRGETALAEQLKKKENVEFVLDTLVVGLDGTDSLEGLWLEQKKTGERSRLSVSGLFVAIGQRANNERFADQVRLDEAGYIRAGEDCVTSAEGIFAAGDCRTKQVRQLTTAAADGAVAGLAACRYIDISIEEQSE